MIQTQAVLLQPVVINPVLASKFALSLLQWIRTERDIDAVERH
jgi:hypothetical protein